MSGGKIASAKGLRKKKKKIVWTLLRKKIIRSEPLWEKKCDQRVSKKKVFVRQNPDHTLLQMLDGRPLKKTCIQEAFRGRIDPLIGMSKYTMYTNPTNPVRNFCLQKLMAPSHPGYQVLTFLRLTFLVSKKENKKYTKTEEGPSYGGA